MEDQSAILVSRSLALPSVSPWAGGVIRWFSLPFQKKKNVTPNNHSIPYEDRTIPQTCTNCRRSSPITEAISLTCRLHKPLHHCPRTTTSSRGPENGADERADRQTRSDINPSPWQPLYKEAAMWARRYDVLALCINVSVGSDGFGVIYGWYWDGQCM